MSISYNIGASLLLVIPSVGSKKKPQSFGFVFSDGEIKAMIGEAIDEASLEALNGTSRFFSKKGKIIIDVPHHTDHLLNTITRHYVVDQWSRQTFTHTLKQGTSFNTERRDIRKRKSMLVNKRFLNNLTMPNKVYTENEIFYKVLNSICKIN